MRPRSARRPAQSAPANMFGQRVGHRTNCFRANTLCIGDLFARNAEAHGEARAHIGTEARGMFTRPLPVALRNLRGLQHAGKPAPNRQAMLQARRTSRVRRAAAARRLQRAATSGSTQASRLRGTQRERRLICWDEAARQHFKRVREQGAASRGTSRRYRSCARASARPFRRNAAMRAGRACPYAAVARRQGASNRRNRCRGRYPRAPPPPPPTDPDDDPPGNRAGVRRDYAACRSAR